MRVNDWTPKPEVLHQGAHRGCYGPNENPMFSVITITKNRLETMKQTMASVAAQTYRNYEYIIIDSASSDGSQAYFDQNPHLYDYYISESDESACDGINRGFRLAKGQFVYLLFSDDWIPDDFLEKAAKGIESFGDDFGFFYGDAHVQRKSSGFWIQKGDPQYRDTILYTMPTVNFVGLIIKREMIEDIGFFDLDVDVPSDYDFLLRGHVSGWKGKYIPGHYSYFRKGGNSTVKELKGHFEVFRISCRHAGISHWTIFFLIKNIGKYFIKSIIEILPDSVCNKIYKFYHSIKFS